MTLPDLPAWGRRKGHLRLPSEGQRLDPQGMHGRTLAVETAHRYAWAYDERDLALLRDVLAEDIVFEGSIAGVTAVGPVTGREAVVEWLRGHMGGQTDQRRHTMQNHIVTAHASDAVRVVATLLLTSSDGVATSVVTSGFYVMDLRRETDMTWRLGRIFGGFDCPF